MAGEAKLQPGVGFHLQPDGTWSPENIPPEVLRDAEYSGYLTIEDFRCFVFETESKDQWAQKAPGTAELASRELMSDRIANRVAALWLYANENDLTSQVTDIMQDEREDTEFDAAIVNYVDESFGVLEGLNQSVEDTANQFFKASQDLSAHKHPRIEAQFAAKLQAALMEAGHKIKAAGDAVVVHIVSDLKKLKDGATPGADSALFEPDQSALDGADEVVVEVKQTDQDDDDQVDDDQEEDYQVEEDEDEGQDQGQDDDYQVSG